MSHPRIPCKCADCKAHAPGEVCADCTTRPRVETRMHYFAGPGEPLACGEPDLPGVASTSEASLVTCGYCLTALTGKP